MLMSECMYARKTRVVSGVLPQEIFLKLDALRLLLGPFLDKSRGVVVTISFTFGGPTCIC